MIFFKFFNKFLSVALTAIISLSATAISCNSGELPEYVYLGGEPFGLKMYSDGVMIVELESYFDGSKYVCPAKKGGLKESDIIKEINGTKITSNETLREAALNSDGNTLEVTFERDNKTLTKEIVPIKNTAGNYLIGAWVRDSSAGIGTVTYYDKSENYFAGLGHGICDSPFTLLLNFAIIKNTAQSIGRFLKIDFFVLAKRNRNFSFNTVCTHNRRHTKHYIVNTKLAVHY